MNNESVVHILLKKEMIPGTILKAIYLGGHIEYTVDCILGELFVIDNQMESKQNLYAAVSITLRTRGVSLIPES